MSDVDKRTRLARLHLGLVEDLFRKEPDQPSAMFETVISRSTVIGEAQRDGKTTFQTHPTHRVTEQYRSLARELEQRLAAFMATRKGESTSILEQTEAERAHG